MKILTVDEPLATYTDMPKEAQKLMHRNQWKEAGQAAFMCINL